MVAARALKMLGTRENPVVAIVSPCFNEGEVLPISIPRLLDLLGTLVNDHSCSPQSFVILVDDGSSDQTWLQIGEAASKFPNKIHGIKLARNFGHQNALMAGLQAATGRCDAAISMDVDLQDDLNALPLMIEKYRAGAEIVLGLKKSRTSDSRLKRFSAGAFYNIMRWMGVSLVANHADCRLMSSKALLNLAQFPERALFLRGLQPLLSQNIATVSYDIEPRLAGKSKYSLSKMLTLAWNGITSFSIVPLRMISWVGAVVFLVSLVLAVGTIFTAFGGSSVPGWASITVPLYLLGGLLMLSIGIVGEYVGKVFLEVKERPRFLVDAVTEEVGDGDA